jgi:hypothetical protein
MVLGVRYADEGRAGEGRLHVGPGLRPHQHGVFAADKRQRAFEIGRGGFGVATLIGELRPQIGIKQPCIACIDGFQAAAGDMIDDPQIVALLLRQQPEARQRRGKIGIDAAAAPGRAAFALLFGLADRAVENDRRLQLIAKAWWRPEA